MDSLTNCEFLVKGYHYTKPTDPIRTDSCRLYLDTSIAGESSNVDIGENENTWGVPSTGTLTARENFTKEVTDDMFLMQGTTWEYTLPATTVFNSTITITGTAYRVPFEISFPANISYYETFDQATTYLISINYNAETKKIELILAIRTPTDVENGCIITYDIYDNYKLHLKGIHGLYAQI